MDFIKLVPSPTFLSVLEELHTCPGAPKRIRNFFAYKKESLTDDTPLPRGDSDALPTSEKDSADASLPRDDSVTVEEDAADIPPPSELLLLTSDVKWCHEKMRERGMPQRIHELINQSKIILPAYEPPPRNPELEARIQKLRNQQANLEYRNMTRNVSLRRGNRIEVSSIGHELREMHREVNRHIITGLQYIVSIVGTFFALYVGLGFAITESGPRLLVGIIGALTVGVAEIYFIIREDIREEAHKNKTK